MRKALVLTRNFPPYVNGDASRVWKIATNLPEIGWEAMVVAPPSVTGNSILLPSGRAKLLPEIYRTGSEIDVSKLDAVDLNDLLHGKEVAPLRPFGARLAALFGGGGDGASWLKDAGQLVDKLLAENPDIDMLYAQGPPVEPLILALETAKQHHLTVVLDITAPLDPAMPDPGTPASTAAAREEELILLSGVPMITTTRALKEYFLKKYFGRLDHGGITIVPQSFDASQPGFGRSAPRTADGVLRIALLVDDLSKEDLRAAIVGLESWATAEGIVPGAVELLLFGEGVSELMRRTDKSMLKPLLTLSVAGVTDQLWLCRQADLFCALLGQSAANAGLLPDRLVDALGLGLPLAASLPPGPAARLVEDAGGAIAPAGDAAAIAEMFRRLSAAWRSRTLRGASPELAGLHATASVIHELTRAITSQYVR